MRQNGRAKRLWQGICRNIHKLLCKLTTKDNEASINKKTSRNDY
jgi:hypothetical protein